MPTLPELSNKNPWALFVLILKLVLSVEPIKLVTELVPVLPVILQLLAGVAKVDMGNFFTRPVLMVKILSVIDPVCTPNSVRGLEAEKFPAPLTSNLYAGVVVPIPILPLSSIRIFSSAAVVPWVKKSKLLLLVVFPIAKSEPVLYKYPVLAPPNKPVLVLPLELTPK